MRTEYSLTIHCSPEHLWPFIEEPELQILWMKGLLSNQLTSEPPAQTGSTFRLKIREGGQVHRYDGEITALDRPRHLGIRFWGGSLKPGMVMRVDYRLQGANDHTRLEYLAVLEKGELSGLGQAGLAPHQALEFSATPEVLEDAEEVGGKPGVIDEVRAGVGGDRLLA